MSDMIYTRHAETRTQQRAIRKEDIRLIQEFGTPYGRRHLVDAKPGRCPRDRKPQAGNPVFEPAQKSQGRHSRGERVITAYPSRHADQKRALRRGRQRGYH